MRPCYLAGFMGRNVEPNNDYCTDHRYCHRLKIKCVATVVLVLCAVTKHWHPSAAVIHQLLADKYEAWQPSAELDRNVGINRGTFGHTADCNVLEAGLSALNSSLSRKSLTSLLGRTPEIPFAHFADRYPSLSVAIGWTHFALTGRSSFARKGLSGSLRHDDGCKHTDPTVLHSYIFLSPCYGTAK